MHLCAVLGIYWWADANCRKSRFFFFSREKGVPLNQLEWSSSHSFTTPPGPYRNQAAVLTSTGPILASSWLTWFFARLIYFTTTSLSARISPLNLMHKTSITGPINTILTELQKFSLILQKNFSLGLCLWELRLPCHNSVHKISCDDSLLRHKACFFLYRKNHASVTLWFVQKYFLVPLSFIVGITFALLS